MDMDAFRRDGFTVVKNVFTQEMRTRLDILRDQLFAQIEAGSLTRHAQFTVGAKSGDYEPFALHPPLVALAREVLGDQDISLYLARALVKDQHFHSDVEAHQDYPYFQGNITKLNAFVAVTPCDRSNGMLELYRGSHNYGPLPRGAISVEFYPQFEACVPSLDVGDVLLADFLLWHGSVPAEQPNARAILQLVYQPADDPSSRNVVCGCQLSPLDQPPRIPIAEPEPSFSYTDAKSAYDAGDLDTAHTYARALAVLDSTHIQVQLLLHDIARARGDGVLAEEYLNQARKAFASMEIEIGRRG